MTIRYWHNTSNDEHAKAEPRDTTGKKAVRNNRKRTDLLWDPSAIRPEWVATGPTSPEKLGFDPSSRNRAVAACRPCQVGRANRMDPLRGPLFDTLNRGFAGFGATSTEERFDCQVTN
jgi:hypothetical protein